MTCVCVCLCVYLYMLACMLDIFSCACLCMFACIAVYNCIYGANVGNLFGANFSPEVRLLCTIIFPTLPNHLPHLSPLSAPPFPIICPALPHPLYPAHLSVESSYVIQNTFSYKRRQPDRQTDEETDRNIWTKRHIRTQEAENLNKSPIVAIIRN